MVRYIMSITAQDRAGIVAKVSGALLELGGNVEAASQTVHQGYFAMIVLCGFEAAGPSAEGLREAVLKEAGADLHVYVTEYRAARQAAGAEMQGFIVTAVGADRPGILCALANYLASKEINIDDLYGYIDGENFVVICQVSVPVELDVFMLQADLEAVGAEGKFRVNMQHENIFVATNELAVKNRINRQ